MNRADWALLVLAAAEGKPLTPLQLQKSLFLLGQGLSSLVGEDFYDFEPYDYGPFAAAVYWDVEDYADLGWTTILRTSGTYREYAATKEGLAKANQLAASLPDDVIKYWRGVVAWVRSQTFAQLTKAIYEKFPAYAERSVMPGARFVAYATRETNPVLRKVYTNQPFMAAIEKALKEDEEGTSYTVKFDDLERELRASPRD